MQFCMSQNLHNLMRLNISCATQRQNTLDTRLKNQHQNKYEASEQKQNVYEHAHKTNTEKTCILT